MILNVFNAGSPVNLDPTCTDGSAEGEEAAAVLLTVPITGVGDLHIRVGDDPCMPMAELCTGRSTAHGAVTECLDQLVPPVQKALERSWQDMHDQLMLSDAYFCGCRTCALGTSSLNAQMNDTSHSDHLIGLLRRAIASRDTKSPFLKEYNEKRVALPQSEKVRHYRSALELVPSSAYVIDQLGLALKQRRKGKSANLLFRNAVAKGIFPSVLQRPPRFVAGLPSRPWYDPADFRFTDTLISKSAEISGEYARHVSQDRSGIVLQEEGLHGSGRWEELVIMKHGVFFVEGTFGATVGTIKAINQDQHSPVEIFNAKFSILHPGTSIRPHCGPSNARLRLHLTIQDAGRAAWIRVGHQNKTWVPGSVLIFDDSFEHEVQNTGNTSRVVLILDFWHPQLPASERIYL